MFVVVDAPFSVFPNMLVVVEPFAGAPNEKADGPAGLAPKGLDAEEPFALPVDVVGEAPPKLNENAGLSDFSAVALVAPGVVGVCALPPEPNPNKGFGKSAGLEFVLPKNDGDPITGLGALPNVLRLGVRLDEFVAPLPPPPKLKENLGAVEVEAGPVEGNVVVVLGAVAAGEKPKPDLGAVKPPNEVEGKEIFDVVDDDKSLDGVPKPNEGAAGLGGSDGVVGTGGVAEAVSDFENPNENFGVVEDVDIDDGVPAGVVEAAFEGSTGV